ncbi:hypothetical protein V6N13_135171 [Hibiscus sabdariffa]|uniref:Uncharacterized protein n=1 Tax=Hibiscus sabdariffa TaxID=183260 RepID=A0ABR2R6G3_9ROSI
MESTKKKGLFFKGRLTKSLYSRVTAKPRPAPAAAHQQSSKVVPYSHASSNQPTGSFEQTTLPNPPFSTQRVTFNPTGFYDRNATKTWGPGDENVDMKAASFISNVRERFKLD